MATEWANAVDEQIKHANHLHLSTLKKKKSLFYKYSLLCNKWGELDVEDVAEMVNNIVSASQHNMAERIREIKTICESNNWIITSAVKKILHCTPKSLEWVCIDQSACFEAKYENNIYSINLMTGLVLFNGSPPSHLPNDVLQHPLYIRSFGNRNFETILDENGMMKTAMPVHGYIYEFTISREGSLLVREIDKHENILELLNNAQIDIWAPNLPIRLKELNSHWLCRAQGKILIRPIPFHRHTAEFIIDHSTCYRIPTHERSIPWTKQQLTTDNMILYKENYFHKIERRALVHTFIAKTGIKFHLPRFDLEFELSNDDGIIRSLNYSGYTLSKDQNLGDTLPMFDEYIILENGNKIKVLIPEGIVHLANNKVQIQRSEENGSTLRHRMYDVHQRFRYLKATSVGARLQLAALYAATGTLLPEPRLGITGGEAAMNLVRQSWVNRALNEDEQMQVKSIIKLAWHTPALVLLCYDLDRIIYIRDVATEYLNHTQLNEKSLLTDEEEFRILGHQCHKKLPTFPLPTMNWHEIIDIKIQFKNMLSLRRNNKIPRFPLIEMDNSKLEKEIMSELRQSWKEYYKTDEYEIIYKKQMKSQLEILRKRIIVMREKGENNLQNENKSIAYKIQKAANLVHKLTLWDLIDTENLPKSLINEALMWQQLCVLEDKLDRLLNYTEDKDIIRELLIFRNWKIEEHPLWLAFEVEQQIQIRPEQSLIAQYLIANPGSKIKENSVAGSIVQLNMGEGKTRIILPMLALHLANGDNLLRLNFLSPLLSEAYDYLHNHLCASVFRRKLFLMPFNRDHNITETRTQRKMIESLKYCLRTKGILLVAPEHRLSLILKNRDENREDFARILENFPFIDILDESDELLHYKYQLVYAVGDHRLLPSGNIRWCAWQSLLNILRNDEEIQELLSKCTVCENSTHSFPQIRIVPGRIFDYVRLQMKERLIQCIVENPPYEFMWLRKYKHLKDEIISFVTVAEFDPLSTPSIKEFKGEKLELLLSLRGLMAFDIFEYCLQQRHCVNYGVCRPGKKRLAIPFKASNVPSERAEFAHPDCALGFTMLSYYYDGLSKNELIQTIQKLQSMGPNAQRTIYKEWLSICKNDKIVDSYSKIDLSNSVQLDTLYNCYQFNMFTINFWLNNCVFPSETMQYTHRLSSNAWHLANNKDGKVVGFSGTNDTPMLLPLQVAQKYLPELSSTNGKMLSLIIKNPECICLPPNSEEPQWKTILDVAYDRKANAIMDAGALFAGKNEEIIDYLCLKFPAVVYFEEGSWFVKDKRGNKWAKHSSPIDEADAFVYYDENHCRGADMKLLPQAMGLLTLGPSMCKSKLMQAAGRMRQLDKKQTVIFIATEEIAKKIRNVNNILDEENINSRHIIQWVTKNTVIASSSGLALWTTQGKEFCRDIRIADNVCVNEMYGHPTRIEKMSISCRSIIMSLDHPIISKIRERVDLYGDDFVGRASILGEEMEREVEREIEAEEEQELQIAYQKPRFEINWDMGMLFNVQSPRELSGVCILRDTLNTICHSVSSILWADNIYCTKNFLYTCENEYMRLNEYLRPVDYLVIFNNKEILLISEREANTLLPLLWNKDNLQSNISLQHLLYAEEGKQLTLAYNIIGGRLPVIKLFNGETTFPVRGDIHDSLRDYKGKTQAKSLVRSRGFQSMIPHSDLEEICAL